MNHERRTAFRVRLRSAMVKLFPAALIKETLNIGKGKGGAAV